MGETFTIKSFTSCVNTHNISCDLLPVTDHCACSAMISAYYESGHCCPDY